MTRRRWTFPSLRPPLATGMAVALAEQPEPAPEPQPVVESNGQTDTPRPLSWDAEDAAIAAGQCPWCGPDLDFVDTVAWVRHVVMHARGWQTEAIHSERLRRAAVGKVRLFADEVAEMARGLGGAS